MRTLGPESDTIPDQIPPELGWHGLSKVLWATEWGAEMKWKFSVSPAAAWTLSGE